MPRQLYPLVVALGGLLVGCEIRSTPALITVYSPAIGVSFPLPQGWSADEAVAQAGFHMQTFTGRSVDVPGRPGIRVQLMAGPTPKGDLGQVAERYRSGSVAREEAYSLEGYPGRTWHFVSEDGAESSRLMLTDVEGTLYGLFVRGESPTMQAYDDALARMWRELSIERGEFFDVYEAPGGDVSIPHPRSWERTQTVANPGESLFVGFRSPPIAVEEDGTTVHVTLEVTVNRVGPGETVESFYAERTEALGDNYRLLKHEVLTEGTAISTLYHVETQLADYLERTIYVIRDDKKFILKFNARNRVYHAVEPWIDEIVRYFLST
ncbi:MAG TPA: hypothetical protein VLK65_02710 [Vicinamibacteria bacterium]|nr:hypothetical protein [Vicinamibacteria bacterium]